MRIARTSLILALPVLIGGCFGFNFNSVRGSGNLVTESRNVSDFTEVEVSGDAKLIVEQGDTESLSITADDNLMQYLTSDVRGSRLQLGTKEAASLSPSSQVIYKLTVKKLNRIDNSGSVVADVKGIRTDSLSIGVSGSAEIAVSGEADVQKLSISGSARYDAPDFRTKNASIDISGSGKAVVAVSDNLEVHVSGSGDVEYIGNPKVTRDISGAGSIKARI